VQLLTLNLSRSRNNIVKICQRIDRWFTLRSTPYRFSVSFGVRVRLCLGL